MRFYIKTYGCQMNVNDSEKMRHILTSSGHEAVEEESAAEVIIINSCAVREKPQDKIFSYAGRIGEGKKIIVAGCVAQSEKENILKRNHHIDYVIGTHQYYQVHEIFEQLEKAQRDGKKKERSERVVTRFSREWQESMPDAPARDNRVSGFISIMEGCDNFCSYCIVPFTRGREKHRPYAHILDEAGYLAEQGYREIILLGQNVNNWQDRVDGKEMRFPALLDDLAAHLENTSVRWIRFITSYPGYYDDELIEVMARREMIARHIHFPAQSGSTRILKKMNRVYTRSQYLKIIKDFKKHIPGMKFSSDFIVGYPGETQRDFELTLSLIEKVEYESIFSFVYSPRPHTKANRVPDNIPLEEKKERLHRLQELQGNIQLRNNKLLVGREIEVLVTGAHPRTKGEVIGRTGSYLVVNFVSTARPGDFRTVRVEKAGSYSLRGVEI